MSWFPVDDALHSHPKGRKAGLEALGLWTVSGSFCMAYLTDGFVPEWFVKEKPRGAALARRLVDAGLWTTGEKAGEKGYLFHQWKPECTKEHVLSLREKARQRKAKSRESQRESHVTAPVTDAVSPATCLVPTQPNPTQPITKEVNLGGRVTSVDARETCPPPTCSRHRNDPNPPNCIACKQARIEREVWDIAHVQNAAAEAAEIARAEREQAAIDRATEIASCGLCDDDGYRNLVLCDHVDRAQTAKAGREAVRAALAVKAS